MKPWTFRNSAPWRGALDFASVEAADYRKWSRELGGYVPAYPFTTAELTGAYWSIIQAGGGEGGTTDMYHWTPAQWRELPSMPAQFRGFIRGWVSPDDQAQDSPNLDVAHSGVVAPVYDLSRLPDGGKYLLGWTKIENNAQRDKLLYPDLLRNDPNYGTITLSINVKQAAESFVQKFAIPVITGLASIGLGALGFPALALSTIKDASKGDLIGIFTAGLAAVDFEDFDVGDLLADDEMSIDAGDFTQNAPGLDEGGVDPSDVADTEFPEGYGTDGLPDDGTIDDNPDPTDNNSNPYQPSHQPGMPNAPIPPRKPGVNTPSSRNPTPSKNGGMVGSVGNILESIFGTNQNHGAAGYPAGKGALPNAQAIGGARPVGSGATPAGIASMFASPVFIAILVAGGLALAMTK